MKIRIVQDGLYANLNRRAQECQAGDVLETGAAYAQSLVEDGYAEYLDDASPVEDAPKKAKARTKKEKNAKSDGFSNPFIG